MRLPFEGLLMPALSTQSTVMISHAPSISNFGFLRNELRVKSGTKRVLSQGIKETTYIDSSVPHVMHGIMMSHIIGGIVHVFRHHRHPMHEALWRRLIALRAAARRSTCHWDALVAVTRGTCAASRYVMWWLRG
ncbi:uncharacterized protein LOC113473917 isoform X1 [Diaphorina citri]|uniref:Uncharacterized protein LOC113473917 isoform X1 n=1 Tax=Diaphorina citri TaxID=121845 RepID=A0A3Q0JLG1_DIACI|nr:uncharacterized protein LOC113473917 isoform X1 [Diaphorina citri]